MYVKITYIWAIFGVNVSKYAIHIYGKKMFQTTNQIKLPESTSHGAEKSPMDSNIYRKP